MNKSEFLKKVAIEAGITEAVAVNTYNTMSKIIIESLQKGEDVKLSKFGNFSITTMKARTGVNPKTKETIQIPEIKIPKFSFGKSVKKTFK